VAGFRDVADPRVTVADRSAFPVVVRDALPGSRPFPHGADGPATDWSERVAAMGEVLSRLAAGGGGSSVPPSTDDAG
jgi:hypothetical protein